VRLFGGSRVSSDWNMLVLGRLSSTTCSRGPWRSAAVTLLLLFATAMVTMSATIGTASTTSANVRNLGALPGNVYSIAFGINNHGQLVGLSDSHAFLWQNDTMTDLGGGWANGINNLGQAVGGSGTRAVLWEDGAVTDLGTLPGDDYSVAYAINDAGQVVGASCGGTCEWFRAFLWQNGTMTDLGSLGGPSDTIAFGINNVGQIVGRSAEHAFLWDHGTMTDLGVLPTGGGSEARAINDAGQVVGSSGNASVGHHAFLWQNSAMTDLGTLPGDTDSYANGINSAGQVVGTSDRNAFLWDLGTMTNLGTLGGCCGEAHAINDHGQAVGESMLPDQSGRAALWTVSTKPPPPYPIRDLGAPPGDVISWGTAINDAGHVAGHSIGSDSGIWVIRVFLWNNGTFQVLPGLGGTETFALGINEADDVVGYGYNASGLSRAILWQNGNPTDLGTLGGTESGAYGINDRGQVVGWSYNATGQQHAFLWDQGNMTDLGTLPGGSFSTANAINEAGQVVGAGDVASGVVHAFLWQSGTMTDLGPGSANGINDVGQVVGTSGSHAALWENGGMVDLGWGSASSINHAGQIVGYSVGSGEIHGFLWYHGNATDLGTSPNDTSSQAVGINRDGHAVGFSGDQAHAVLWTLPRITPPSPPRFPMRNLGFLPAYNFSSIAYGVNDVGQVVGTSLGANGVGGHAFLWDNGTMTDLGTLGGTQSVANAINNAGQVVGWSTNASGAMHAFLWENGAMTDLGTLAGDSSEAHAINGAGQVVGFSSTSPGWDHAFLWDNGTMIDLGTLGGGPYYDYSSAYGINDAGQVVGWTVNATENTRAFLWDNGTMTDLGPSGAYAINIAGEIVGDFGPNASLWINGAVTDLGTLGGLSSGAFGINQGGQIVGGSDTASGSRAFLWENGTMTDLGVLAADAGSWSYGVNNVGQAVGTSWAPYGASTAFHAVIWTIPRPTLHDVAVRSASASMASADVGVSITITATVVNRGTQPESFDVSAYAGSLLVGTKAVTDLAVGSSQDLSFSWDTSSAAPGSDSIRVEIPPIPYETDVSNNVASGGIVRLAAPVTAQASGTPSATDVGRPISFSCDPTDGTPPYQFFWDFGDGSHGPDSTASHAFTVSGTKNVTCTITDSGGKEWTTPITVLVNPVPTVTVSADHAAAGPGAVLTFSAHVTGGTGSFHYVWDFGDETAGTGATVTHSYANPGEHRASVIVTDTVGGTGEGSATLMVSAFTVTAETSANQAVTGDMISFTASATGAAGGPYTYTWDFGDGTTEAGATATHSYATAGTFAPTVTVTDSSGFSQEKSLSPITVEGPPPSTSASPSPPWPIAGGLAAIAIVAVLAWAALRRKRPLR